MKPTIDGFPAAIYNGSGFAPGFALASTTTGTTTITTATESCPTAGGATTTITTTPRPSLESSSSNNKSDSTKIGIGVGIGVGVPLLAALAAVLFLWSRERKRNREYRLQQAAGPQVSWDKPNIGYEPQGVPRAYHEVPGQIGDDGAAQMVGGDGRRELPANSMMRG